MLFVELAGNGVSLEETEIKIRINQVIERCLVRFKVSDNTGNSRTGNGTGDSTHGSGEVKRKSDRGAATIGNGRTRDCTGPDGGKGGGKKKKKMDERP